MKSRDFGKRDPILVLQSAARRLLGREVARLERIQKQERLNNERPTPEDTEQLCGIARAAATLTAELRKTDEARRKRDGDMTMDERVASVIALLNDLPPARLAEVLAAVRREGLHA